MDAVANILKCQERSKVWSIRILCAEFDPYMQHPTFLLAILLSTFISCNMQTEKSGVDTILFNGAIQTVDDSLSVVEAIAIKNGLIEAVGTSVEINSGYHASEIIDLEGQHVYPGLIDPHCHFYGYGMTLRNADLTGTESWEDVLLAIQEHQSTSPSEWV